MNVTTCARDHAALFYHILSYLDLGLDAATLYRPRATPLPFWAAPLLDAYRSSPGQLFIQILPLVVEDLTTLEKLLQRGLPALNDAPGRALRFHLLKAIAAEQDGDPRETLSHRSRDVSALLPRLETLRSHLWAEATPPPLELWDCPALAAPDGTHTRARGTTRQGRSIIALSFDVPDDAILIQVLHEDTHALTDPPIRKAHAQLTQQTSVGSDGYRLHQQLERAAVEAGQTLLERHAPDLLPAYRTWRARYGMLHEP
jgi:hypothetical protein